MDADLRSRANKDPLSAHPAVNPNAAGSIYGAAAEADQAAHPQNTPEYSVAEGFYGPDDGLIDSSASYPEAMSAHLAIGGVTKEEDGSYDLQINNTHHHVNERGVPLDIQ